MLKDILEAISPVDENSKEHAKKQWDQIAKPLNSMGLFEDMIIKIAGIQATQKVDITKKCLAVMCADNGIVAENVTQASSQVTAIIAENMANSKSCVAKMASIAHAHVYVYDVGMLIDVKNVENRKVAYGTKNFAHMPAMTHEEAIKTIETGINIVGELKDKGYTIIATGEMGIGNTTTSSAIASVLLNVEVKKVTGPGAGLSTEGVDHKISVIKKAITLHKPNPTDIIDVISKIGGFDIAALCGLFIGAAYYKIPIIIDGFISSISALLAYKLCPLTKDYMLASMVSAEPAATMILNELQLQAPLHCNMALGEGTGAVTLLPLLDMAIEVYSKMPTFSDMKIEEYVDL